MSDAVYITDAAGVRYRVLDGTIQQGKTIVANPPAPWAKYRIFRPQTGHRRLYYFQPAESRAPEPALLAQQLQRAEYLPSRTYEPPADPR